MGACFLYEILCMQLICSSETILDLDWSSTPDMQSILAVGYAHRVDILCQQRMTYFDDGPGWAMCRSIEISRLVCLAST